MRHYTRPARRFRPLLITTLVALCFYFYVIPASTHGLLPRVARLSPSYAPDTQKPVAANTKALVPLEAHIMSKCPDAKDCMRQLVLPTMQRVVDKVNFTLSFIGQPTENDGVECMHGAEECTFAGILWGVWGSATNCSCLSQVLETSCSYAPPTSTRTRRFTWVTLCACSRTTKTSASAGTSSTARSNMPSTSTNSVTALVKMTELSAWICCGPVSAGAQR